MDGLIRQGDILLVPVEEEDLTESGRYPSPFQTSYYVKRQRGEGIILAEGEATGHHHRVLTKGAKMYRKGRTVYLTVPKSGAELTHEEHETLEIPAGKYRLDNQREYAPQAAPVRVYD